MDRPKDFDLAQLRHFYSVAYFRGFSRASRATGLSQPALSAGLKKLERELGTPLATRTSTEFELTPAGASVFEFCKEMETKWTGLLSVISNDADRTTKRLRVGTAISVGCSPVVRLLREIAKSGSPIEAEVLTADSYQLMRDLQEGKLDLAFLPDDVRGSGLRFETFTKEQVILVASKSAEISIRSDSWRKSLLEQLLVTYPRDTPMRALVDRTLIREKIRFRSEVSANGIEAIKLLVQREVGLAFVLKSLVQEEIASGLLKEVVLPIALPKRGISIASRVNDHGIVKSSRELLLKK